MLKKIAFIFAALIIFVVPSFGQEVELTREDYEEELNRLVELKDKLNTEISSLNHSIDSARTAIPQVEAAIKECRYNSLVKEYGEEIGSRIYSGQIWKGMTEQMMLESWGKPDHINTNKEPWGVYTQYTYGDIIYFFKNSELIHWEEGAE